MKHSQVRNIQSAVLSVINLLITVLLAIIVVYFLYQAIQYSYSFGYRMFNSDPIDKTNGHMIEYTVEENAGILEIAQDLEKKGLIEDAYVMVAQKVFYSYTIYPGTYSLSTTMTSKDILDRIGTEPENIEEEE